MFVIRKLAYLLCFAGAGWASLALMGLEPSGVPGHIQLSKMVIVFIIPGGIALLLGCLLYRRSNRRMKREEQLFDEETNRKEAKEQRLLADFYKDERDFRKSGFPLPDTGSRPAESKTPKVAAAASGIAEGVCRSCGARKTLRDGISAECDYCGSVISAR